MTFWTKVLLFMGCSLITIAILFIAVALVMAILDWLDAREFRRMQMSDEWKRDHDKDGL